MMTTEAPVRAPAPDALLTLTEAAAYLGVDATWLDGALWEADQPARDGEPERWKVETLHTLVRETELPGDGRVLDLAGIATFLGVAATTPQQWRQRDQLPPADPDLSFPDKPVWRTGTIRRWAMFPPEGQPKRWPPGAASRSRPAE